MMSAELEGMLGFAIGIIGAIAFVIFAILRKKGRPKTGLEFLVSVVLLGALIALGVTHDRQNATWRKVRLESVRKNPLVQQVLEEIALDLSGDVNYESGATLYRIARSSGWDTTGELRAHTPYLVVGLGAGADQRPVLVEATLMGRAKGERWPDASDPGAFRTLCFWLPDWPNEVSYFTKGGVMRKASQERARAFLYDVESGRFFLEDEVRADDLPMETTNVRDTKLTPKNFAEFMEWHLPDG